MPSISSLVNNSVKSAKATVKKKIFSYPRILYFYIGLKALVWGRPVPNYRIPELKWVNARRSDIAEPRINLFILTIKPERTYGGIHTALKFFEQLSCHYKNVRLIILEDEPDAESLKTFSEYRLVSMEDDINESKQMVSVADCDGRTLAVGPEDIFVATIWYSAYLAQRLVSWQSQEFNQFVKPIVYLIQDYEPGFYAWCSQYLIGRGTYEYKGPMIAVFNTDLLRQYFYMQNYRYEHEYSFEPKMNEVLCKLRPLLEGAKKHKQLLVYGRPSAPRNAFSLIIEALRMWRSHFPQASTWTVLSVGEPHPDIDLGDGVVMRSIGKLSLENYARTLSESSVGLSLMVSPHPSYPPLEMAHYGMWVLTNSFDNKDLSLWHDNIVSLKDCFPESIAHKLSLLCRRVEEDPTSGWYGKSHIPHYLSDDPSFPFIEEIYGLLKKQSSST